MQEGRKERKITEENNITLRYSVITNVNEHPIHPKGIDKDCLKES